MGLPVSSKGIQVAILLATLGLSALFLAQGTTGLIAGELFPFEPPAASKSATGAAKKAPGTDPPDIHAILARNAFDPETGSLWPPKVEVATPDETEGEVAPEEPEEVDPNAMPPGCDSTVRLVATLFSERQPDWSIATLAAGSEPPLLYRKGSRVADREVAAIFPRAVYLRQANGKLCSLTLFTPPPTASGAPAPVAAAKPAEPTPAAAAASTSSESDLDQNITKVSDTQFTVQRSFVDKLLMNQAEIMRSARVVPHEENGQVVGVKLYGIRRNSLLGKLGMQNGDLLKTINGFDMASPDSALEAYAKLRNASNISVSVTRRGQPVGLEYQIQ